jgi:hypothetical protein
MRKREVVKIDGKEITVKELTVREVLDVFNGLSESDDIKETLLGDLPKLTDATADELIEMAPSDLETLVDAARRVNASFFKIAQRAGLGEIIETIMKTFKDDFLSLCASK